MNQVETSVSKWFCVGKICFNFIIGPIKCDLRFCDLKQRRLFPIGKELSGRRGIILLEKNKCNKRSLNRCGVVQKDGYVSCLYLIFLQKHPRVDFRDIFENQCLSNARPSGRSPDLVDLQCTYEIRSTTDKPVNLSIKLN